MVPNGALHPLVREAVARGVRIDVGHGSHFSFRTARTVLDAGIAPFNSPFLLSMKKVAFALAAGNTFVLKPSDLTPLSGPKIAAVFAEAGLPAGVLNVIPGPAALIGAKFASDPRVRMITFTGSSRVGRQLAAECGRHMKRVTLEMGGTNPLVVLRDADLDYAVDAAAFGIFFHQGQVCMASSRVIAEAPLYDAFLEKFVAKGARLCCCGSYDGPFFAATVLRADDYEHALDFALRSKSGMVHDNDTTISDEPHIDFGGVKDSGFGREGGMASIAEMTEVKWITFQMGKRQFPF